MICVVCKGSSIQEVHLQITKAIKFADLIELRLDYLEEIDEISIRQILSTYCIPMILTLRRQSQGGFYKKSEEKRLKHIRLLASLEPAYLDIEATVPQSFVDEIAEKFPKIKLIISYHNFSETPLDIDGIYKELQRHSASYYKIALKANSTLDALRLMSWVKELSQPIIAISMGSLGQISRILGPIVGSIVTYACLEESLTTRLGQLTGQELIERYHYRELKPSTAIYGLIGDPVEKSISDITHNACMQQLGLDAVYVKMQIKIEELPEFFQLVKKLPFRGLSVTMPLKEKILDFVDRMDSLAEKSGAINTLLFEDDSVTGYNTDGVGALNALERETEVIGKKIVVIGAGGAAKAIIVEAIKRGGLVTIINRDAEKAAQIARQLGCHGKNLDAMRDLYRSGYDILINCTPADSPIDFEYLLPSALVMDINTRPKETLFLQRAQNKGCRIVYGYQMFVEQAALQYGYWYQKQINPHKCFRILEKQSEICLS